MLEITNADRAGWALSAIEEFVAQTGVDTASSAIGDLMANLLHLARGRGLDTLLIIDRAYEMMINEFAEDTEGHMKLVQRSFRNLLKWD